MKTALALLLALAPCAPLAAQTLPDLKNQAAWGEKEKQDFLKYLKAGGGAAPAGNVKALPAAAASAARAPAPRKAKYLALALASESLVTVAADGRQRTGAPSLTAGLTAGGHLFSWVRYYAGARWGRPLQEKTDGHASRLNHFEVPLGVELALIPLGTPHTRYVLLRAGVSQHYFSSSRPKQDFHAPLQGWHETWNVGVGYEWQFDDSNFRANIVAEAAKSFDRDPGFYKAGLSLGLAYTF